VSGPRPATTRSASGHSIRSKGITPANAGTLIVAQRKTGKTTLLLNYARCLIDGAAFLDHFEVRPVAGRVAMLNYEVSAPQLARWADEAAVDPDRLYLVNLRSRRNPLNNPEDRARLAAELRAQSAEVLIVDPFSRAYSGLSQNDPGEVGAWLTDLDLFARAEVGATDVVLAAHAGWDGERTRGSSALEDWADSVVTLVRGKGEDGSESQRFLRAMGRDVEVDEDQLEFDPRTRTLRLSGAGSRKVAASTRKLKELVPEVVAVVTAQPGITAGDLAAALKARGVNFQKGNDSKAAQNAVQLGWIRGTVDGRSKRYWPATHPATSTPEHPEADRPADPELPNMPRRAPVVEKDTPHSPSIGGGNVRGITSETAAAGDSPDSRGSE
jgi:AAA domain